MEAAYLLKEEPDIKKGRYAVYGDDGELVTQDDDPRKALSVARASAATCPAIVDLEITQGHIYIF